ncbi:hypothetical protein AJ87_02965 [Rhizobium yanglingense]|nr:hypothetical protein AJ87_02965 [Rhizobium yanglingense]
MLHHAGIVDGRHRVALRRNEARTVDLGAGKQRGYFVDRLVALRILFVEILRTLLVLQIEFRLLRIEILVGERVVACRRRVLVLENLLIGIIAEAGRRYVLPEGLVLRRVLECRLIARQTGKTALLLTCVENGRKARVIRLTARLIDRAVIGLRSRLQALVRKPGFQRRRSCSS